MARVVRRAAPVAKHAKHTKTAAPGVAHAAARRRLRVKRALHRFKRYLSDVLFADAARVRAAIDAAVAAGTTSGVLFIVRVPLVPPVPPAAAETADMPKLVYADHVTHDAYICQDDGAPEALYAAGHKSFGRNVDLWLSCVSEGEFTVSWGWRADASDDESSSYSSSASSSPSSTETDSGSDENSDSE